MEYRNRKYLYSCTCGYSVSVFIDFGAPQETYKCRMCGSNVKRQEID